MTPKTRQRIQRLKSELVDAPPRHFIISNADGEWLTTNFERTLDLLEWIKADIKFDRREDVIADNINEFLSDIEEGS